MKRLLSRLAFAAAIVASVGMLAQSSAYANPGAFALAVSGGGSISPGLTATPTFQSGTFSGTVAGLVTAVPGVAVGAGSCNFSFSSTIAETAAQGQGSASGTCTGGTIGNYTINCVLIYIRVGPIVIIVTVGNCSISASGPTGSGSANAVAGAGVFLFAPTTGNGVTSPITSYALAGAGGAVAAP